MGTVAAEPISAAAKALGDRVRTHRHDRGESQEELADEGPVQPAGVGQVERGRRNVSLHNILKLAQGLEIDPCELVRGLKPPAAAPAADKI